MGVGGGFWELLKGAAKFEDLESLRGKRLAIDLSYWVVQQESVLRLHGHLKPHLRLTFFRVVNLFARIGAFPIFVVDGEPPALKMLVRMQRFSRISGIPVPPSVEAGCLEGYSNCRNEVFDRNIQECVELLELLGMPVLQAKGEAEALCAELNQQGIVDACVTPDGDCLLYGAKHVIKQFEMNYNNPVVESYSASDIESLLGLGREHLVALGLLVGCDYNQQGVPGIGCANAVRLVLMFPKDQIIQSLRALGKGEIQNQSKNTELHDKDTAERRNYHCSNCGHPGNRKAHFKEGCHVCGVDDNCIQGGCRKKTKGFRCTCEKCFNKHKRKQEAKNADWWAKTCLKIAEAETFPDDRIINIYLSPTSSHLTEEQVLCIKWKPPEMVALEEFLSYHLHWASVYIRRKSLPLLSLWCLREMAENTSFTGSILGRYVPHSIKRIKIYYSRPLYVLRWTTIGAEAENENWISLEAKGGGQDDDLGDHTEGTTNEVAPNKTGVLDNLSCFTTDEDLLLVKSACPKLVQNFENQQASKKTPKRKIQKNVLDMKKQRTLKSFFGVKENKVLTGKKIDGSDNVTRLGSPMERINVSSSTPASVQNKTVAESTSKVLIDVLSSDSDSDSEYTARRCLLDSFG